MLKKINWPTVLWAIFILIICGIPGDKIPELKGGLDLVVDKVIHVCVFGLLSFLWIRRTTISAQSVLLYCALYGAIIEVLQVYVFIHRTGEVLDWFADSIGATLGILLVIQIKKHD